MVYSSCPSSRLLHHHHRHHLPTLESHHRLFNSSISLLCQAISVSPTLLSIHIYPLNSVNRWEIVTTCAPLYADAASGVLFQSLPPSAAGGGAVGQTSAPGGGFQFSPPGPPPPPPPSLFAPQNFPPPLFARPPGSISTNAPSASGGGLPPPPPLAPAPGITSLQQAAGSSRPPVRFSCNSGYNCWYQYFETSYS